MTIRISPCWFCKHMDAEHDTCEAFPGGIPDKFLWGKKLHKSRGKGVQFEPEKGMDPFVLGIVRLMGYQSPAEVAVSG